MELDKEQKAAVETKKRNVLVAATRAKEKLVWMTEMPKKKPNYKMQNWG